MHLARLDGNAIYIGRYCRNLTIKSSTFFLTGGRAAGAGSPPGAPKLRMASLNHSLRCVAVKGLPVPQYQNSKSLLTTGNLKDGKHEGDGPPVMGKSEDHKSKGTGPVMFRKRSNKI